MKSLIRILLPVGLALLAGCVVAPRPYYGPGYYRPHVAVVAPAPVIVVRP